MTRARGARALLLGAVLVACGGGHVREREPMAERLSAYRSLAIDVFAFQGVDAASCDLARFHAKLMQRAAKAELGVPVVVPSAPAELRARAIVRACVAGSAFEKARVEVEVELYDARASRVVARVDIDAKGGSATLDRNLEVRDHASDALDLAAERVVRFLRKHR